MLTQGLILTPQENRYGWVVSLWYVLRFTSKRREVNEWNMGANLGYARHKTSGQLSGVKVEMIDGYSPMQDDD